MATNRITSLGRATLPALPVALAAASTANAQVIYTNVVDTTVYWVGGTPDSPSTLYFDFGSGGGTGSISTATFGGADFYLSGDDWIGTPWPRVMSAMGDDGRVATNSTDFYTQNFSAGALIGENTPSFGSWNRASPSVNFNGWNDTEWSPGTTGFLGFRMRNSATNDVIFGWARVTYGADHSLTLHDFAYEATPGVGILAGATSAIPEPASAAALMSLLAGSAALFARRRVRGA